jgi:hypothetical protein
MTRYRIGMQCACKHCDQDIENHGARKWLDRGGNRACCPVIRKGEIVKPKTKHAPYTPKG